MADKNISPKPPKSEKPAEGTSEELRAKQMKQSKQMKQMKQS